MTEDVTVLMPVHNGQPFIGEAIESVLRQSHRSFQLLIVDDGSTDNTVEVVESFKDGRIRLVRNPVNVNRSNALNQALELSETTYVARMDADDVCLPHRLERQVVFMDDHPEIAISGSWIQTFGGKSSVWRLPTEPMDLRCRLLFHCDIAHPSVIMRREALRAAGLQYRPDRLWSEDWDLWQRASRELLLANLPEVLLRYRVKSSSQRGADHAPELAAQRHAEALGIVSENLCRLGLEPTPEEIELHYRIGFHRPELQMSSFARADSWLERLLSANQRTRQYPAPEFRAVVGEHWFYVCYALAQLGSPSFRAYRGSRLSDLYRPSAERWLKFAARVAMRRGPANQ